MFQLDLSLTPRELNAVRTLIILPPLASAAAALSWCLYTTLSQTIAALLLPLAFSSHAIWLLFALKLCGVQRQPSGAFLPMKFRAVLYLDVFGWLQRKAAAK